ncbi:hypothetical protein ScPMuIL_009141 [Solemya velum]
MDLRERVLEITVWDYDRIGASDFLGEVLIDLHSANLYDEPFWYQLGYHDDTSIPLPNSSPRTVNYDFRKAAHLSPPVSSRGMSDSDMSELDFDDGIGVVPIVGRDSLDSQYQQASDTLAVPEQRNRQRSRSPIPGEQVHPTRVRSRSPAPHHRVPEKISRSLSPPGIRSVYHTSNLILCHILHSIVFTYIGKEPCAFSVVVARPQSYPDVTCASKILKSLKLTYTYFYLLHYSVTLQLVFCIDRSNTTRSPARIPGGTPSSTPSPKKRQLPAIPLEAQMASRDRVTQDLEERARQMKMKMKLNKSGISGPLSDNETYRSRNSENYQEFRGRSHDQFSPDGSDDVCSDASETSDMSEVSKVSTVSIRSTQSERPRRKLSEFTSKMESRTTMRKHVPQRGNNDSQSYDKGFDKGYDKNDGSISDSALNASVTEGRKRRPSLSSKVANLVGLSRRSSSASMLTEGKKKTSFQRSEEVGAAGDLRGHMLKQASKESTDGSIGSISSDSGSGWLPTGLRVGPDGQFGDFIEGLGPAQLVGRQVLGSPCFGEIQLGLYDRKGHLEVEVIRARGLTAKQGAKILPAPYVKVYLIDGKTCVEKQKTTVARRTLDPLYQQQLVFTEPYAGKILQVTVWGDYGRMDRKVFMGVAQILLDHLDLSNIVIGWYKLFTSSSLVGHHSSSTTLTPSRKGSSTSLDSGYNNSART